MNTDDANLLWSGQVGRSILEPMVDRLIDRYFKLDSYYRIDGKPVFSIYHYPNLVAGLGGVAQARDALTWMHKRAIEKGLPGLHIQAIGMKGSFGPEAGELGFDSSTSYQFTCDAGNEGDYVAWANKAVSYWELYERTFGLYFPHVSIGWDNTQRHPSMVTAVTGSTPDAFEAYLSKTKRYLDARPDQAPLVTINSWNEWTEGSYLLPDMHWGYRYLQAVRNVFGAT